MTAMTTRTAAGRIAAGKRAHEDEVVERFRGLGAVSAGEAVDVVPGDPDEAACFDTLRANGVIRGANGGFFLDEEALQELRARRRGWLYGGLGATAVFGGLMAWLLGRRR